MYTEYIQNIIDSLINAFFNRINELILQFLIFVYDILPPPNNDFIMLINSAAASMVDFLYYISWLGYFINLPVFSGCLIFSLAVTLPNLPLRAWRWLRSIFW